MTTMMEQVFKSAGVQINDWDALEGLFSYRKFGAREPVLLSGQAWRQLYYTESWDLNALPSDWTNIRVVMAGTAFVLSLSALMVRCSFPNGEQQE